MQASNADGRHWLWQEFRSEPTLIEPLSVLWCGTDCEIVKVCALTDTHEIIRGPI
jgi:hypothetical protein